MSRLRRLFADSFRNARSSDQAGVRDQATEPVQGVASDDLRGVLIDIAALGAERRFVEAYAAACRALERAPDHPDLLFAKATALLDNGRFAEARALYEQLEQAGHASTPLRVQLAWACHGLGDDSAGEAALRKAIAVDPDAFKPRYALGSLLSAQKRDSDAVIELERAVELAPHDVDARIVLGNAYMDLKNPAAAEAQYRRATEIAPERPAVWTNVGYALVNQNRYADAIEAFGHAYDLERRLGGDADAYMNIGVALADEGRVDEAIGVFESNLAARPAPRAHWSYALALLRSGGFTEGWPQHEFRLLLEPLLSLRPDYGVPVWAGQDLRGKTVVVRAEQGLGDTIQMLRYVPAMAALGARVLLRAPPGFESLALGVDGVAEVLEQGAVNPPFDYYAYAMSLPGAFGTTLATIPAEVPYIRVDPDRRERWRTRLGTTTKRNIGLVWAGSPVHLKDRKRSMSLQALMPLLELDGLRFVLLQKGPALDEANELPSAIDFINLGPELEDLADTAAVIDQLDLVIGVDTAVVHLAGALAKPVWAMVARPCDWRWLENRDDSPWYPTLRLYRQTRRDDWGDVVARLASDLAAWANVPASAFTSPASGRTDVATLAGSKPGLARVVGPPGSSAVSETRWGLMQYVHDEPDVGESLAWYGEWLEPQIRVLARLLRPGATIVEIGAGVGAHTMPLAQIVGTTGRVYATESRDVFRRLLRQNCESNRHSNVAVLSGDPAAGPPANPLMGTAVSADSLDAMLIDKLDLLKTAPGVHPRSVLDGSRDVLWRMRPVLFLAVADARELAELSGHVKQFGYRCWRMDTPLFNPDNFNRRDSDVFAGRSAIALLAIPEEVDVALTLAGCVEIA